ncbi:MAG TPA: hypothetical protein VGK22_19690 [Candidatus Angelobacter sp.]|jgi:hypothetical protein
MAQTTIDLFALSMRKKDLSPVPFETDNAKLLIGELSCPKHITYQREEN